MSDSIFVRVQRVVSGGAQSAVDVAERLSGTSLMRQAIREMDEAIDRARRESEAASATRSQAEHGIAGIRAQLATLKEQASFALTKGRDDLAEAAISRQLDLEAQAERLGKVRADAADEQRRLDDSLASMKVRKTGMEQELAAFQAAQNAAAAGDTGGKAERKATRAEEAFERAMATAGGVAGSRPAPAESAKVAEIEALQKQARIEERLAALRAAGAKAPAAKKGRRAASTRG